MLDINIEDYKISEKKIVINSRSIKQKDYSYNIIKCYQNLSEIEIFECKGIDTIKIHKTFYHNLSNLIQIDLSQNKLSKVSKNFKIFKNLEVLKLDDNQIIFIPSFISEFLKLKVFTISNNYLTTIPSSIQYVTSLQTLKFSNNKIVNLPIEFGLLKSLEILHMDGNYFTEIPTTLCYLRHLIELSFEWLEFINLNKNLKETMGKEWINIIRDSLQEMIKSQILYCDFVTFIEKISANINKKKNNNNNINNNINNNNEKESYQNVNTLPNDNTLSSIKPYIKNPLSKYSKIFLAVENNYYSVIKSLLSTSEFKEYLQVKNEENKTPFYIAIHNKNEDLIELFLSKISLSKIPLSHIYLHKAIRVRNPDLVKKLIDLGININLTDDQGNGVFHILFSSFTKQLSKCALIGNYLIERNTALNIFNNDNWAPIHIAARKGSKECLLWIIATNQKLRKEGREEFDLNLKGLNNWTPLHLTINSFRMEETLILLHNKCDVFARNCDCKTPKKVSVGNYVFSKLLTNYENHIYEAEYKNLEEDKMFIRCYTNVDDDEYNNNNHCLNNNKTKTGNYFKENNQLYENNNSNINDYNNIFQKNSLLKKNFLNNPLNNKDNKNNNKHLSKTPTNISNFLNIKKINNIKNPLKDSLSNNQILNSQNLGKIFNNNQSEISNETENINFQRDILLNSDSSAFEKYESFMNIKLSNEDLRIFLKNILDDLDLESDINLNILCDICNFAICNFMIDLIPILKQISESTLIKKSKYFIKKEIDNTIIILGKIKSNINLEKYQTTLINQKKIQNLNKNKLKEGIKSDDFNQDMFYNNNESNDEEIEYNDDDEDFNFGEFPKK